MYLGQGPDLTGGASKQEMKEEAKEGKRKKKARKLIDAYMEQM